MTSPSAAVKDAVEALRKAMIAPDRPTLEKLTTDDLRYGHANGHSESKKEFIDGLIASTGYADIVSSDLSVKLLDNIAVVNQNLNRTNRKGGVVGMQELSVWVLQNDQWKILARQAGKTKD